LTDLAAYQPALANVDPIMFQAGVAESRTIGSTDAARPER